MSPHAAEAEPVDQGIHPVGAAVKSDICLITDTVHLHRAVGIFLCAEAAEKEAGRLFYTDYLFDLAGVTERLRPRLWSNFRSVSSFRETLRWKYRVFHDKMPIRRCR